MNKMEEKSLVELIYEIETLENKKKGAQNKLKQDPIWQELMKWEVLDWNSGKEALLKSGLVTIKSSIWGEEWVLTATERCHILNFPEIKITDMHIECIIFDSCGKVSFEESYVKDCNFVKVDTILFDNSEVDNSTFKDLHSDDGEFIISMEDSTISNCRFRDIKMENETYLCDGIGDCLIEKCQFDNVFTDRADRELFICQEAAGKILRKSRTYDMVERESCTGI